MYGYAVEDLYNVSRRKGRLGRIWSTLSGHSRRLLSLSEIEQRCKVRGRQHASLQPVLIDRVRGSDGRCSDFDANFNPVQDHCLDRWLGVARARQAGKPLPPVELVQIGEVYFCLDGHHRLSVARAFGEQVIDAEVTVWEMDEALPWEEPDPAVEPVREGTAAPDDLFQVQFALTLDSPMPA
jgi:hypothetical protein